MSTAGNVDAVAARLVRILEGDLRPLARLAVKAGLGPQSPALLKSRDDMVERALDAWRLGVLSVENAHLKSVQPFMVDVDAKVLSLAALRLDALCASAREDSLIRGL